MDKNRIQCLNTRRLAVASIIFKCLPASRCFKQKASLMRWAGALVGKNVRIMSSVKVMGPIHLEIGDNVFIGHETMITGAENSSIIIEDNAVISSRVIIVTGDHLYSADGDCVAKDGISADIRVSKGAVCGIASVILPGKTIGEMSHVAAGAVVTKDVPPYTRVAGVPATVIKHFE